MLRLHRSAKLMDIALVVSVLTNAGCRPIDSCKKVTDPMALCRQLMMDLSLQPLDCVLFRISAVRKQFGILVDILFGQRLNGHVLGSWYCYGLRIPDDPIMHGPQFQTRGEQSF